MKNVRLSSYIKPERYELIIKPDLKGFVFDGEEVISLNLGKAVTEITVHAKELKIESVSFEPSPRPSPIGRGGKTVLPKKIVYDEKAETATFVFGKKLPKGGGELRLKFKGILNDKMRGFYRSSYIHQGKQKHIATTQFEATDARRAFPCFDEPAHKAVFDITLMVPKGMTGISNTLPIDNPHSPLDASRHLPPWGEGGIAEDQSGYNIVKFLPTPKMSTYLAAFIVGDFEHIEGWAESYKTADKSANYTPKKTLVRVFVTPGKKHQAKFALETAIRCLEFYNEYFDIPYPLPVLDLIAIPDFTSTAMENWGAVTYRESALLVDEIQSSLSNKQWVAIVIAHELAHQWFGNLVTMKWWTHLWLNEGFASYMEHLTAAKLFPKWKIWEQFVSGRVNQAMELDALGNTHPIEVKVNHPSEISEIFDAVSYAKGSSVIRMLAEYLGEETFKNGLRYYLKKHAYKNTSTEDLWEAFEIVSKKPVTKIMRDWTQKPGYPLIKITKQGKGVELEQSRFYSGKLADSKNTDKTVWQVPLAYTVDAQKSGQVLLDKKCAFIKLPKNYQYIKFNAGEKSLARISYQPQMLGGLGKSIKNKSLPVSDRLGIIRDAFSLAESGHLPTAGVLELAKNFQNEDNYNTWLILASGLATVDALIYGESFYNKYQEFCQGLFSSLAAKTGWRAKAKETGDETLLRSLALRQAGKYGDGKVIKKAQELFNRDEKIPSDIRGAVYSLAASYGNAATHSKLAKLYINSPMQEEKDRIARALASFKQVDLLKKTLSFAISKDVRSQDSPFMVAMVLRNNAGTQIGWGFVKKNWDVFLKRYGSGGLQMIARIVSALDGFKSSSDAVDIRNFFKTHKAPGAERTVRQVLEKIYSNEAWLKRDGKNLENWLNTNIAKFDGRQNRQ
jgi:puromycin-sensitive aminopeptidase